MTTTRVPRAARAPRPKKALAGLPPRCGRPASEHPVPDGCACWASNRDVEPPPQWAPFAPPLDTIRALRRKGERVDVFRAQDFAATHVAWLVRAPSIEAMMWAMQEVGIFRPHDARDPLDTYALSPAAMTLTEPPAPRRWVFKIAGEPATKRGADMGRSGRGGAMQHMHPDRRTENYEMLVAGAATEAGLAAGMGPCRVQIDLVLSSRRRKDADRVCSAIFDGMKRAGKRALYDDNLCIVQVTAINLIAVDEHATSAIVTVTMLEKDRSR